MNKLNCFLIISNATRDIHLEMTKKIEAKIKALGGMVVYDVATATPDCLLVIGGDGTVIDAFEKAIELNIPLVAVNMGRLGFLAEVGTSDLSWIEKMVAGEYTTTQRMLLSIEHCQHGGEKQCITRLALNEVCLKGENAAGLADITLTDNLKNQIRYRGDGLIVATPSGSTAYSFSAGGPVIDPTLEAFCVTPICAHSFFNRAMVLGADAVITLKNTSSMVDLQVNIDGREVLVVMQGEEITVSKSNRMLKMITFGNIPTFTTLRTKMELAELKD